jgi:hypothetical protein
MGTSISSGDERITWRRAVKLDICLKLFEINEISDQLHSIIFSKDIIEDDKTLARRKSR